MPLLRNGTMRLVALAFLLSLVLGAYACRTSVPPAIDICIGDGFGGANCVLKDGTRAYLSPSQLRNYWMTPQADMGAYSAWCYDTSTSVVAARMSEIAKETQAR